MYNNMVAVLHLKNDKINKKTEKNVIWCTYNYIGNLRSSFNPNFTISTINRLESLNC